MKSNNIFKNPKLKIDLIPKTSFYENVRNHVDQEIWDKLRRYCYRKACYVCEICGGVGPEHPVECHELFSYESNGIQKLVRLMAVCPLCHKCYHIGRTNVIEGPTMVPVCLRHIAKVNGWTYKQAQQYITYASSKYRQRSTVDWTLDISLVDALLTEIEKPFDLGVLG